MKPSKQNIQTEPGTPFCTIRQFVTRSGLSEKSIREMVRMRAIPFVMAGNRTMIDCDGAISAIRDQARQWVGVSD